jgi:hypothetical protein
VATQKTKNNNKTPNRLESGFHLEIWERGRTEDCCFLFVCLLKIPKCHLIVQTTYSYYEALWLFGEDNKDYI